MLDFLIEGLETKTDAMTRFLEKKGLRAGDRLAVFLPSSLQFLALLFASLRIGSVFCPLNLRIPPAELKSQLSLLSPKLFISKEGCEERVSPLISLPPSSFLLFTSGSTGRAKIASLTLENLLASAGPAATRCNLNPGDAWLLSLPLFHVGGLGIVFRCLLAGAKLVLESSLEVTHISYVPTQLYRAWPVYPRLKCVLLGGGPIAEIPPKLPIITSYALTETSSLFLADGFPLSGKEIELRNGEIFVRGDSLFQGYFNGQKVEPQKGWFGTKDLGEFDPKKGYRILGRKDHLFISGGENIQPEEIERELLKIPEILEAIVVPKQDPEFGARPVAWIRTLHSIDPIAIASDLAKRLPKYKIPIRFCNLETLPDSGLKRSRKKIFELTNQKI
ncbi:MAG TPA: AMP-binding protein [Chlamydiales bacterium]|jgi:O-succinylbenzoic acid--CoA ligase|nr:AMP-binding protein [Chlamydiales bacterium]